jgi:hypothetical protein
MKHVKKFQYFNFNRLKSVLLIDSKKDFFRFGSTIFIWIRDAPDTVFAGYPAYPKAGYRTG